jgi:homeobox protein cut-like
VDEWHHLTLHSQILHGELEASLRSVSEDLTNHRDELEKQKILNEKLETDLLQVNQHINGTGAGSTEKSGASTPAASGAGQQEGLAGLNIGQKGNVSSEAICSAFLQT